MSESWLPLVDYSNKYRISISTLRRRIKLDSIPFKLAGGKYYIIDESPDELEHQNASQAQERFQQQAIQTSHQRMSKAPPKNFDSPKKNFSGESQSRDDQVTTTHSEPVFSAANRLLDELKKAYTLILQEKDEHIRNLREEISDLKTLVRVLEGENARLSSRLGEPLSDR
ncbi:MAG TPA: hypothetical protein VFV50_08395 [Bdellovibrionales bacterium]|nr:hypothetical protein [Bdellovibrionales bacterium]